MTKDPDYLEAGEMWSSKRRKDKKFPEGDILYSMSGRETDATLEAGCSRVIPRE